MSCPVLGVGASWLSRHHPFFLFRRIEPGAVPLAGERISSDTLPLYGGSVSGSFKGPGQVAPWVFGTGCPLPPVVCLFAFLCVLLQPWPCAFLEVCLIYMNSSRKVQLKSSFFCFFFFPGNSQEPLVCDLCV